MTNLINRLAMASAIAAVGFALFGLFFRAVLYGMIFSTPGQVASKAAIVEHMIVYGVLLLALAAMVFGVLLLMVPAWRNVRLAVSVLITSLVTPPVFYILYALVAKWLV